MLMANAVPGGALLKAAWSTSLTGIALPASMAARTSYNPDGVSRNVARFGPSVW